MNSYAIVVAACVLVPPGRLQTQSHWPVTGYCCPRLRAASAQTAGGSKRGMTSKCARQARGFPGAAADEQVAGTTSVTISGRSAIPGW